jgi:hypothetical protein
MPLVAVHTASSIVATVFVSILAAQNVRKDRLDSALLMEVVDGVLLLVVIKVQETSCSALRMGVVNAAPHPTARSPLLVGQVFVLLTVVVVDVLWTCVISLLSHRHYIV